MLKPLAASSAVQLREIFTSTGFSEEGLRNRPGLLQAPTRRSAVLPLLIDRTREPSPVNQFVRLFILGLSIERSSLSRALPDHLIDALIESGAVEAVDNEIRPHVMISPLKAALVANDLFSKIESEPADLILWPNSTTRMLWKFALRHPVGSVLDLGTGSGVIALRAAAFGGRVTATDLNPRAAEFVNFNASLNGVENIEALTGDTFEPVAGRKFDLILCNPPFFITPVAEFMYGENSMELDGYCRRVIREGSQHLAEGGHLQMLFEWAEIQGEPWRKRLLGWLDGAGCDAWLVRTYTIDPTDYAHQRNREQYAADPVQATERFNRFLAYYRERSLTAIHGGLLTLRRRSGKNWIRVDENRHDPEAPVDDIVTEVLATEDMLRGGEEVIARSKPLRSGGLHLEKQFRFVNDRCMPDATLLKRDNAFPSTMAASDTVADFLAKCDGTRTVQELSAQRPDALDLVRRLAERRMIRF